MSVGIRILLLGANGQLGAFAKHLLPSIGETISLDYPEIDFTQPSEVCKVVESIKPDVVFNSVAYTNVDQAEDDGELCGMINTTTPGELAKLSSKLNFLFIHFSTDFVYGGQDKSTPYTETDETSPINEYGRSKVRSEELVQEYAKRYFIFRPSWLYSKRSTSFVGKVLNWSRKFKTLKIVEDQIGSPTSAFDLGLITTQAIKTTLDLGEDWITKNAGIYNLGGDGYTSRYQWAKQIVELDPLQGEQVVEEILPARSSDFPTKAQRPAYSPMDCTKFKTTFGLSLPDWQTSLAFLMNTIKPH